MRIVHFSDWHGGIRKKIPEADLYVCTGDMLDNFPVTVGGGWGRLTDWPKIVPEHEKVKQAESIAKFVADGGMRPRLGSPDAPIVCVRGNHDFVSIKPLFQGCNMVHEFLGNEVVEVAGLKVTGHRGIPYIYGGWSDEESRADLKDRMRNMPHADVYLTHYPPAGVLDHSAPPGEEYEGMESWGLEGMADFLLYRATKALHCFGHIHECGGHTKKLGDVTFSNAACSLNVIDF